MQGSEGEEEQGKEDFEYRISDVGMRRMSRGAEEQGREDSGLRKKDISNFGCRIEKNSKQESEISRE